MKSIRELFDGASDWDAWLERVGEQRAAWEATRRATRLGELEPEYAAVEEARFVIAISDASSPEAAASLPQIARALEADAKNAEIRFLDRHTDAGPLVNALGVVPAVSPLCLVYDEDWTECGRWAPRSPAVVSSEIGGDGRAQRGGGAQVLREFLPVLRGEPAETRQPWKTLTHHLWRQVDSARRE